MNLVVVGWWPISVSTDQ